MAKYAEIEGWIQGLLEESAVADLWQSGENKTSMDSLYHSPAHLSLRQVSTNVGRGWVLTRDVRRADPGRGLCWLCGTA